MKRTRRVIAAIVILASLALAPGHTATPAESLFQKAIVKELGEGDPEGAIPLYQNVLDVSGGDQRLAAKARLHMGACLERIGKWDEAEKIYLQMIDENRASIQDAVEAARANLEGMKEK